MVDLAPLLGGIGRGGVDHVQEEACPLEVREELVAETDALAGTLDQPGDVGDGQLPAVGCIHRAEHRLEGRERVLGDLRPGIRDPAQERRLACVREADERGVGDELQPQLELGVLAGQPGLGEARRLARRRCEMTVPAPAAATSRDDDPSAGRDKVGNELLLLVDLRPDRQPQLDVGAVRAVLVGPAPVLAAARPVALADPEPREVAEIGVGDERNVSPAPAVTAVGPALRHELLAAEAEPAVAAASGGDVDVVWSWNMARWSLAECCSSTGRDGRARCQDG